MIEKYLTILIILDILGLILFLIAMYFNFKQLKKEKEIVTIREINKKLSNMINELSTYISKKRTIQEL